MGFEWLADATSFREHADLLLLEHEAANNLILGVSGTEIEQPGSFDQFQAWVGFDSTGPVIAAAQTPPSNLILAVPRSGEAVGLLAAVVGELPGVIGLLPWVETFVIARPETASKTMSQGIFELEKVIPPPSTSGESRQANHDDLELLIAWFLAFRGETIGHAAEEDRITRNVERRLAAPSARGGFWLHVVDDRPVAMSGHSGPTPNGVRIGPVYTPPGERGRGYATNLVATQSQWLLNHGHRFCFLYTDLSNPISNSIYERIGYRQVAESAEYSFTPSTG